MIKFKTKKELKEYTKNIIYDKVGITSSIKNNYPQYWDFFIYLFSGHYDYNNKIKDMDDIIITNNKQNKKYLEINIKKNNGDIIDISYNKCISGKPKDNLTLAMRNSITPQIMEFKKNNENICVLCGSDQKIHIDHFKPQFIELKKNFLLKHEQVPEKFDDNYFHSKIFKPEDLKFQKNWEEYHKKNCCLRVLCQKCNLSRPKIKF